MIFIGLELTGLSLYLMTAFDKSDRAFRRSGPEVFPLRQHGERVHALRAQLRLRRDRHDGAGRDRGEARRGLVSPLLAAGIVMTLVGLAFKVAAAPFHLWAPDAYQAARFPPPRSSPRARKSRRLSCSGKSCSSASAPSQGSAEWHAIDRRLVARSRGARRVLDRRSATSPRSRKTMSGACSPTRPLRTPATPCSASWRDRDGFAATLFYTTIYALTLLGAFGVVALGARRDGRRRSLALRRLARALTGARRLHGDLHALARRSAAARRILRQILPLQRRAWRRRKPRAALARGPRALRQPRLALLLPDRAEGDLRRRGRRPNCRRSCLRHSSARRSPLLASRRVHRRRSPDETFVARIIRRSAAVSHVPGAAPNESLCGKFVI